jgi:hypothetical protein
MYFVAVSNINFLHNAMEILFSYGRNRCRTINGFIIVLNGFEDMTRKIY